VSSSRKRCRDLELSYDALPSADPGHGDPRPYVGAPYCNGESTISEANPWHSRPAAVLNHDEHVQLAKRCSDGDEEITGNENAARAVLDSLTLIRRQTLAG
jgi:hypothetical protein